MIPETEKTHNDLIDIMIDACQKVENVEVSPGEFEKQLVLDPKRVWLKTHIVNSNTFGRYVFEKENLLQKAAQCIYHMSKSRAEVIKQQIMGLCECYDYSIDAKSSECMSDKNNTRSTLIDKINRNKIEKHYTVEGEAKKTFMDGLLGREAKQESQE
jgi:hypothetical protein